MAYLENFHCFKCDGDISMQVRSSRGWCGECENKEFSNEKKRFLAGLKVLTVEERLALLEAQMYNMQRVLEKLEAATALFTTRF